ncbi:MAG TPA: patatin-like phospholipase family protein [Bryobacteraceae bacterium]|jgi:NTE family protein|nr:patatin-like phospholipase family protein [Bryobacteraceae bacterium]
MSGRALVLGGGGPVGIAWESGLIAGLAETGVDLSAADFILGTSAGSVVGAQLAMGRTAASLAGSFIDKGEAPASPSESLATPPDLSVLAAKLVESYAGVRPVEEVCAEIGAWALTAPTMSEEAFLATFGRTLANMPENYWPERRYSCTAVDAESGVFTEWNNESGVSLVRAVASSCAVPGIYPPVTINGRRYMDGGMRSGTNADLARGYEVVVVVSVSSAALPEVFRRPLERELQTLRDSGSRVELIRPDAGSAESFGPNLMDYRRRPAAAEAGIRQGKGGIEGLRELWG